MTSFVRKAFLALVVLTSACGEKKDPEPTATSAALEKSPDQVRKERLDGLRTKAKALFGQLPETMTDAEHPITPALTQLGTTLYHDPRLSKNQDLSCASCHALNQFGIDPRAEANEKGTSLGHKGQVGDRNAPTVFNAALHVAQFWDGRAKDVEEQAKGPVLNPVEMAMRDEASVVAVLKSIPGYEPLFKAAFPNAEDPITYDNMARAIGAFERQLTTPAPFDRFLAGDDSALDDKALDGLDAFVSAGCIACHLGPGIGGGMYQKLGLIKPYPTQDPGRFAVTKNEADKGFFKVPSLRNSGKTAPYFHDGSIKTLQEAVAIMSEHQTPGGKLPEDRIALIVAFLHELTGEPKASLIKPPELPESGPKTPKPDPG